MTDGRDFRYRNLDGTGPVDWSDHDATQRPRLRVVPPPETPPEADETLPVASESVTPPAAPSGPVLPITGGSRTYTRPDGVRVTEAIPPPPPLTAVRGLRAYLYRLRDALEDKP